MEAQAPPLFWWWALAGLLFLALVGSDGGGQRGLVLVQPGERHIQDNKRLVDLYSQMAADFEATGLTNFDAIKQLYPWFYNAYDEHVRVLLPKKDADVPQPAGAGRILVMRWDDAPPVLLSAAKDLVREIVQHLPRSMKVGPVHPSSYHASLFHTSHPLDPRPDSSSPDGGVELGLPINKRRSPTRQEWWEEVDLMTSIVATTPRPIIKLERFVLTNAGTLIAAFTDTTGAIQSLRQRCREAFPGAPTKQTNIIHVSLLRLMSPQQLPPESVTAISGLCSKWTETHRGALYSPTHLMHVWETQFTTLLGKRVEMPLAVPAAVAAARAAT